MEPSEVIRFMLEEQVRHIVQKDGPCFEAELSDLHALIDHPMETICGPVTDGVVEFNEISAYDDKKSKILGPFEEFLKTVKGARGIRDEAMMIADELFTNGAKNGWDPPRLTKDSKPVRPGVVEFFARAGNGRLVLGCRDTYGQLGFDQVLLRIRRCFEEGIAQSISQGQGGAGIGSFMVFNSCISYYASVEKGKRTVVCVALPLGTKQGETSSLPKNIHLVAI
ncbi:MAG: hypothetical protein V4692_15695 [Bdellovibrionota bacterium]